VAEAKLIDYYAVLNLPPKADLSGVANAYARLSDDLMRIGEHDETAKEGMKRLNEAYAVLSKPELRREYDRAFFSAELQRLERETRAVERRKAMASGLLIGALGLVVAAQAAALLYMGWDSATGLFQAIGSALF